MQLYFFILFASLTIISAITVIGSRNVVYCTFALLATLFNVACLYILLGAEFLAAIQLLIYAGAVLILFIFTLMLIDVYKMNRDEQFHKQMRWVIVGGVLLAAETLVFVLPRSKFLAASRAATEGNILWENNTLALSKMLFTEYLFSFEVASLVLLVAIIAAVILGKTRISVGAFSRQDSEE
ncbi:MAG: NADH-quinone oxidoreductase subunit J [Candidatus Schekmanbacteria bacterium]|nr:NADH-quinone oxidoreductase subunit J [Candidatus Schekmanbacteria bacterium]